MSPENPNFWLSDCNSLIDENFVLECPAFNYPLEPLNPSTFNLSAELDGTYGDSEGTKENISKKRGRSESCGPSSSKACREKARRDRLNDKLNFLVYNQDSRLTCTPMCMCIICDHCLKMIVRFAELGSILEPGRPPKTDKAAILNDAFQMVTQLRSEAQKLKDSNCDLQEKIKELKLDKNELRDEKQRLKAEKDKLEQQLKTVNTQPAYIPAHSPFQVAYGPPAQAHGGKLMPIMGYPGVPMWQFMSPAAVDTSQDHVLRPPVA